MLPLTTSFTSIAIMIAAGAAPPSPSTPAPGSAPASSAASAPAVVAPPSPADETQALPPLPATPLPILEIVSARPFTVEIPWPSDWRADRPMVREGWIALLRVPHDVVVPRQTGEPVLLAGATTVERVENLVSDDLVLAIIPASPRSAAVPGAAGSADDDLSRPLAELPIWYGTPGLPEAMDAAALTRELALAERARIAARPAAEVERALARGGAAIEAADRAALIDAATAMRPAAPAPPAR